jgi:hypothetical protein
VRRPAPLTSALAVAALCVLSASAQLNPTVTVLPKPQTQVPSECEEGLAAAQPRTLIAQAPRPQEETPKRVAAPPSIDLKTRLRRVQTAAEQENREEFKAALADARAAVAGYPSGGERDAATDVLRVYDDLERLWDYSFSSPTGSFFDATSENGALLNMTRRYPDWSRSISDATLNVGGQTIYPTRETRRFLTAEASKRLSRLGVRVPTRITEAPAVRNVPAPQPRATKPPAITRADATPHVTRKTTTARKTHRKKTTKIAEARVTPREPRPARAPAALPVGSRAGGHAASRPASGRRAVSPTPPPSPVPAAVPSAQPAPSPVPAAVPPPQPAPSPVPAAVPSPQPAPPPPPETTTTAPSPTASEPAAITTTTTTTTTQNGQQGGGRMNLLFAFFLIIVGIGVLIVLFRASD